MSQRTALGTFSGSGRRDTIIRKVPGPRKLPCGSGCVVDYGSDDHRTPEQKTTRELVWTSNRTFQGWTCSHCEWNSPLPTLLSDADARTAFDRLAATKFREHVCADHL